MVVIFCVSMNVYMCICLLAYTILDLIQRVEKNNFNFENARFSGKGRQSLTMRICKVLISYVKLDLVLYRMAGNFRGSQFSRFSRLTGNPRKLNPRNKKPKRTRDNRGRGHRGACRAAAQLD